MTEFVKKLHNNNRTGNKKQESPEDRTYRLARTYNSILHSIEKVSDAKTYVQTRNLINSFAHEAGKNSLDAIKLTEKLNSRIENVAHDIQENIDRINAEIDKIENDRLIEPVEKLQELSTRAEQRLLHFMMQLGTNNDGNTNNRRKIGNFVKQADRVDACALMKLASLPQYMDYFTTKQKETLLEKSKNPAEIVFERNKEQLLKEKHNELGRMYMKAFNLRNVLKKIGNTEKAYYFTEGQED